MPEAIDPFTPVVSRDELVELVARAHTGAGDSSAAGKALAAQSKLPKLIAENLGAGFGQWDFFPEPAEIVDFALAYAAPETPEDVWALARAWASDDAASRQTLMALVGRDIVQRELRRIEVPELRELFDETKPARIRELRASLGLDVPPAEKAKRAKAPAPKRAPAEPRPIPTRMPKPEFKRPAPPPPPVAAKRFQHPKFGVGTLVSEEGSGAEAKLTIAFEGGSKTLLAKYVTEV